MLTVICQTPGTLLAEERSLPVRGGDEVLVRVKRVGVCGTDLPIFTGLSGLVEEAPAGSALRRGDAVFVMPYLSCGRCIACRKGKTNCCVNIQVLGVHRDGAFTEYLSVPQQFVHKAEGVTLDQAAMGEFLAIGAHAVRRGEVQPGQRVLAVGAGPIGMAALIFSRLRGAVVTALDTRRDRLDFCERHLGVAAAVQIGADDEARLCELTDGDFYDVVFDATGNARAMERGFKFVAHGGKYANCSATVCRYIAESFKGAALSEFPAVDGVVAITHGSGCGMGGNGEGIEVLRRTLRGYADHPNFAGVLVVGLGCEVNQIAPLIETLSAREPGLFAALTIQEDGGTREAVEQGIALLRGMLPLANTATRAPVSACHLTVGLQCGGSDGYSGISANPALGAAVDLLVAHGGTAILSETPEIYGAEHLLTARAASPAVADKLMQRIRWWEHYTQQHGGDMNNNPSPGNKAGGITTILEKSLGAVAKGGSSALMAVYEYAEPVRTRGLVFMDTPGYDPVSATGQVAGGANLICFTTGRGSTYGCKPTPSLKIATNNRLFKRMGMDMDFNAGEIIEGRQSVAEAGAALFQLMLAAASGSATRSEEHGMSDNEFVPWQLGAVM